MEFSSGYHAAPHGGLASSADSSNERRTRSHNQMSLSNLLTPSPPPPTSIDHGLFRHPADNYPSGPTNPTVTTMNPITDFTQPNRDYMGPIVVPSFQRQIHSESRFPSSRDHPRSHFPDRSGNGGTLHGPIMNIHGGATIPTFGGPITATSFGDPNGQQYHQHHHYQHQKEGASVTTYPRGMYYGTAVGGSGFRHPSSAASSSYNGGSRPIFTGDSNQQFYVDDGGYHMRANNVSAIESSTKLSMQNPHATMAQDFPDIDPENRYVPGSCRWGCYCC